MDNHVSRTTMRGISVTEMSMGMVMDNEVRDALGVGIWCNDRSMCSIEHNTVVDTAHAQNARLRRPRELPVRGRSARERAGRQPGALQRDHRFAGRHHPLGGSPGRNTPAIVNRVNDMPETTTEIDTLALAEALRPTLLQVGRELRREARAVGISPEQVSLLVTIRHEPGIGLARARGERAGVAAGDDEARRPPRAGRARRAHDEGRRPAVRRRRRSPPRGRRCSGASARGAPPG